MQTKLIGIAGRKGSGKDTVARLIQKQHPEMITRSYAAPMKEACNIIFGWSPMNMENLQFKETVDPEFGVNPRRALQTLGTEWGRDLIHPDLWVLSMRKFILASEKPVIVTDVRFENEAQLIRALGGKLIHIETDINLLKDAHISERPIRKQDEDWVLHNPHEGHRALEASVIELLFEFD